MVAELVPLNPEPSQIQPVRLSSKLIIGNQRK